MRHLVLAAAALAICAPCATASVTVGTDGSALTLTSTNPAGVNTTSVTLDGANVKVTNDDGVTTSAPACAQNTPSEVACSNLFADLQAQFAAASDHLTVDVCFATAELDLGDGANEYHGPPCPDPVVFSVAGGSGPDVLAGAPDAASHTVEQLHGAAGDDTLTGGGGDDVLAGGIGNDTLAGDADSDHVDGESGDDTIRGGAGNDTESGGAGDDHIGAGDDDQGADTVSGGDGSDRLTFEAHAGAVAVSLDGQANDGAPLEGDNIAADIETIDGTGGDDTFTGSPGPDRFNAGAGNDDLHGADGNDVLDGGAGDDRVNGDGGDDQLQGSGGADRVDGGAGADQLYGDVPGCTDTCSADADALFARDGETDAVDCGGGPDSAQVDSADVVTACASIDAPAQPVATPPPSVKVAHSLRRAVLARRGMRVRVTCGGPCKVTAQLRRGARKLASAHATLPAAGAKTLTLRLSKRAARRLKTGRLTLRLTVTGASGKPTVLTRTVVLRR